MRFGAPKRRQRAIHTPKVLDDDDDKIFEPTELHTFESVVLRSCAMSLKHSLCLCLDGHQVKIAKDFPLHFLFDLYGNKLSKMVLFP